jgi:3-deoxy-7-phosphoheptulonate synthase
MSPIISTKLHNMIIVMKQGADREHAEFVISTISSSGLEPVPLFGSERTVIAVIGDERDMDQRQIRAMEGVEKVMGVLKPYQLVSRDSHPEDTVVDVDGVKIGGKNPIAIMAGPCSLESEEMTLMQAKAMRERGATIFRGGAFKPRTAPYAFQGHGEEALRWLLRAKMETGMKIVTEVMDTQRVQIVSRHADILQVGARNMHNFDLLKAVGRQNKPVLLKRGMSAQVDEWLLAAEYIVKEGNPNVILCERGIRTFSRATRNTLDLNAVPLVKRLSHLPVIVDPSHGTGAYDLQWRRPVLLVERME